MAPAYSAPVTFLQPLTLTGTLVTLEPLRPEHHDGLVEATRDGELWNLWYTNVPRPEGMQAEIDRRLALQEAGTMLPFTVRRNGTGRIIGMTSYLNVDAANRRVEIGGTWNARSARRQWHQRREQAAPAHPCVRAPAVHRGGISHTLDERAVPDGHFPLGRETGRHPAQPLHSGGWLAS